MFEYGCNNPDRLSYKKGHIVPGTLFSCAKALLPIVYFSLLEREPKSLKKECSLPAFPYINIANTVCLNDMQRDDFV